MKKIKYLISFLFPLLLLSSCASTYAPREPIQSYSHIVETETLSEEDFFNKSEQWLNKTFNGIQSGYMLNKVNGYIMGQFTIDYSTLFNYQTVESKFTIRFIDGNARIEIHNPVLTIYGDFIQGNYETPVVRDVYDSDRNLSERIYKDWHKYIMSYDRYLKAE